jgi:hypothetical protein
MVLVSVFANYETALLLQAVGAQSQNCGLYTLGLALAENYYTKYNTTLLMVQHLTVVFNNILSYTHHTVY